MEPLVTLVDDAAEPWTMPLSAELRQIYGGELGFQEAPAGRPLVIANFVTTLDGIVSFGLPGSDTGNTISGQSIIDHAVMGLLRACADAVIWGAGTYAASRRFLPTPAAIQPALADDYLVLRQRLGKATAPLAVIITRSGAIPTDGAIFATPQQPALVVTTDAGAARLAPSLEGSPLTSIRALGDRLDPPAILTLLREDYGISLALHEGGPAVFGAFLAARCIDDLFLTIAPQFAGRAAEQPHVALVEGQAFLPTDAPWSRLISLKRAGDLLFTRYRLR